MAIVLTTPVGRIVQGELWKARPVTDSKGTPKIGADGQPQVSYYFAIAIAKQPGHTHWAHTEWGAQIWAEGHRAHPNFAPHPNFSWKIEDGDSTVPNKKGKKNADREGHAGHWILKLSSNFPIDKTYNANGTAPMPPEAFKAGHFVQVSLSIKGNTGDTPGVYLNPQMVALSGYGTEIQGGPDVSEAGFGQAPLPQGASVAPPAAASQMPAISAPAAVPSLPGYAAPPAAASYPAPAMPVVPDPTMRGGPALPVMPGAAPAMPTPPAMPTMPSAPPAVAQFQMTAAAQGFTRDQYIAQGWTDEGLRTAGMML